MMAGTDEGDGLARSGVTAALGFRAAGVAADIKGGGGHKRDVALVVSDAPCVAAGVFTTNLVRAACVDITRARLIDGPVRAVLVNSGNANACTGAQGRRDAIDCGERAARALELPAEQVLVASTGVIGVALPMDRMREGIGAAARALSRDGSLPAAEAIMTTDTVPKQAVRRVTLSSGHRVTLGGMAKGSGMIHPNMATMLAFVTTDASWPSSGLQGALRRAVDSTFNMVSVDGDSSTNDMLVALANGASGAPELRPGSPDEAAVEEALTGVLMDLAKAIARDGEGATKLLEVRVEQARTLDEARRAARTVASSSLVKTAVYGNDANWGRILAALGRSGAGFDPLRVDLWLGPIRVMADGAPVAFDEDEAREVLQRDEVLVRAKLHGGDAGATAWGCDLTHDYVTINAEYRT